jgi:hypothetical protein
MTTKREYLKYLPWAYLSYFSTRANLWAKNMGKIVEISLMRARAVFKNGMLTIEFSSTSHDALAIGGLLFDFGLSNY